MVQISWTAPKTWSVGETLTAANFNAQFRDNLTLVPHLLALKSADETVSASTVLQNDDHLFFSVAVNSQYAVRLGMYATTSTTGYLKVGATGPAGATWTIQTFAADTTGAGGIFFFSDSLQASDDLLLNSSGLYLIEAQGIVTTAGTAGTFQVQWAQNTATGTTTMKKGSYLIGQKLA